MSRLRLAQVFTIALALLLIGLAPLRLALDAMGAERRGLAAREASGTIWRGRLLGARFGGVELGDVRLGLDAAGLFLGGGRVWFRTQGPISAGGVLLLSGKRSGARSLDGTLPLGLVIPQAPVHGRLGLKDVDLEFRHGLCRSAGGRVSLDQLTLPGGGPLAPALVLSGAPTCRGGAAVIPLSGLADGVAIDVLIRLDGAGGYRLETVLRATNPRFAALAALRGFERTIDGFRRVDQGRLSGGAARP